ncbi:hypothetical protein HL658_06135 [Azospirillum sp. RWY-5-1]|uniref:DUF4062 domain-containing protein n=1 Tax=Azospirillum oleiclasticum TaxID=2735135 RepID=A0ABX2T7P5_9PROT|nr:hypothetical protein [Azospirillum oleiclasticum]NYZ12122.1 hypothetical protein [Azospirillum oleiclasticum]NYZ19282.1 hypothetical protein [Azospirillum oleiclasticum]
MNSNYTRVLNLVVASPGDVDRERKKLSEVVDELNAGICRSHNITIQLHTWERFAYPIMHPMGPQGAVDEALQIGQCDLLIGIFWTRFGTPVLGKESGTEHEFLTAYNAWKKNGSPNIMMYFNSKPYSPKSYEEVEQWGKVMRFKKTYPAEGLWWAYNGPNEFEKNIRRHLTSHIIKKYSKRGFVITSDDIIGDFGGEGDKIPHTPISNPDPPIADPVTHIFKNPALRVGASILSFLVFFLWIFWDDRVPCPEKYNPVVRSRIVTANCGAIGGNNCSGTPTNEVCISYMPTGNTAHQSYLAAPVVIPKDGQPTAGVHITYVAPDRTKVCATANASVGPGGTSTRVTGILQVTEMIWGKDPACR